MDVVCGGSWFGGWILFLDTCSIRSGLVCFLIPLRVISGFFFSFLRNWDPPRRMLYLFFLFFFILVRLRLWSGFCCGRGYFLVSTLSLALVWPMAVIDGSIIIQLFVFSSLFFFVFCCLR
jgi:hypothetical protein